MLAQLRENPKVFFLGLGAGLLVMIIPLWYLADGWMSEISGEARIAETVALRWGDAIRSDGTTYSRSDAPYGIHVWVTPRRDTNSIGRYDVHATCYIGPPGWVSYMDQIGQIGTASDWQDACSRFGTIRFTDRGVYIGDGLPGPNGQEDDYLLPTQRMISHR